MTDVKTFDIFKSKGFLVFLQQHVMNSLKDFNKDLLNKSLEFPDLNSYLITEIWSHDKMDQMNFTMRSFILMSLTTYWLMANK